MVVAGQGVRRGPGPRRRARRRRLGEGLLRARSARSTRCGGRCRAGSRTTSRCPSSTSTSRCTRRWSVRRASRSRCRSAPRRCTGAPSSASPRTGATRSASPAEDLALAAAHGRLAAGDRRPGRVHGVAEDRPRAGRGLRLHAEGQGHHAGRRRHARSTSRTRSTPRSGTAASARGSTAGSCRSTPRSRRATPSRSSRARSRAPARAATGCSSSTRRRPRTKIRQWFSRERRVDAIDTGRDELVKALRKEGLPVQKLATSTRSSTVADALHYADLDALLRRDRRGPRVGARRSSQRLAARAARRRGAAPGHDRPPAARPQPQRRRAAGVHVEGLDDVMVRLSRCCTPVPGDEIMGFVTRGRGVSVHRTDCANAAGLVEPGRAASSRSSGTTTSPATYVVSVEVEALDRSRLLRDVADVLAEHHVNILVVHQPDLGRPGRPVPLRLRARRPRPPRVDPHGDQAGRLRLRRLPGPPRPRQAPRQLARGAR